MTEEAGKKYAGLERYQCREQVLADLKRRYLAKTEEHRQLVAIATDAALP